MQDNSEIRIPALNGGVFHDDKVPNNLPRDMDVVVVIDKDKLPEDVRKMLEQNLPKDTKEQLKLSQDKVFEVLQKGKMGNISLLQRDKEEQSRQSKNEQDKDNRMFAIQTGTVIGNIHDKNFKLDDIDKK